MSEEIIHNPHDKLFKEAFSRREMAVDFFKNYLPTAVSARLDWESLHLEPGSFTDEALRGSESDLLYTVQIDQHPDKVDNTTDINEYIHKAEALNQPELQEEIMTIAETLRTEGKIEGKIEGKQEALQEDILEILELRFQSVSYSIKKQLEEISDTAVLRQLLRLAVQAESIEAFQKAMPN